MADQKLTAKTEATTVADSDVIHAVVSGASKKVTKVNFLKELQAEVDTSSFLGLADVDETTFEGKEGQVPMVTIDLATEPATRKLNFERLPTFTDLLGGNAIIRGGVVWRSALTYNVWASSYIINNRTYNTLVSSDVTLAVADATNPRIDVLAIEVTSAEPPVASVVVITGTPAATPVKPTVDLTYQVEVSFRTVAALATVDPDAVNEVVYDELAGDPTEWDITDTPAGANLSDATDPKVGTVAITLPAYVSDVLEFTNTALYTYVADESLVFYMRIVTGLTPKSKLEIKLRNAGADYYLFTAKISQLFDYGFSTSDAGWQLVQIPLSNFNANSRTITQYDEFEITFINTPAIELDWIVIQGGQVNPSNAGVNSVVAGTGISVDSADPQNPIVSLIAGGVVKSNLDASLIARVTANVVTSYAIDRDLGVAFELTMTGATTFTDSNLETGTDTGDILIILDGNFVPTFPAYWEVTPTSDSYDGSVRNLLTVSTINGTGASEDVLYQLQNLTT